MRLHVGCYSGRVGEMVRRQAGFDDMAGVCRLIAHRWSAGPNRRAGGAMAVIPGLPRPSPQIKKLCLTERQERTSAGVAAAKSGQPHLPRALETRSGLTPEMRMASTIMVGSRAVWLSAEPMVHAAQRGGCMASCCLSTGPTPRPQRLLNAAVERTAQFFP